MESIELRRKVWQAISTLPPHYRVPLTMFHMDGLSHRKVARNLSIALPSPVLRVKDRLL
jgi:DNA-directed RNA polymerase specialized sigma24 family protein